MFSIIGIMKIHSTELVLMVEFQSNVFWNDDD